MQPMDVSVVIPTFNRPRLLERTLDSVLAQTCPPREIIVVDNSTTDTTAKMLDRYANRITQIRIEPSGVQAARNVGIEASSGRWIATLDDDDLYAPTFLERAAPALMDGRPNLVFGDHRKFVEAGGRRMVSQKTNAERAPEGYWDGVASPADGDDWSYVGIFPAERLLLFNVFYPSTMLIERALFEQVGGFDSAMRGIKTEDLEFMTRVLPVARLAFAWPALVDYRMHTSNTSGDLLSQYIGRWHVFEHVRRQDRHGSPALRAALDADLPVRRRAVIRTAFRHGEFDVLPEVAAQLAPQDRTPLTRVLLALSRLPRPITSVLVRAADGLLPQSQKDRARLPQWTPAS